MLLCVHSRNREFSARQGKNNLQGYFVMDMISVTRKPIIVGVMGSHTDDREAMEDARRIGEAIARRGYVLLTGGGPGVM